MLKVDRGSNINCISLRSFNRLFPHQQLTKSMSLLENYNNPPVSIIGKFKVFIWWKGKVFHQDFHVTNVNSSPNLLSRDAFFQMEVLQTCFTVTRKEIPPWTKQGNHCIESSVSKSSHTMPSTTPTSVSQSQLTKEKILEVYADIFNGLETFPGEPYKFRLKENYVPCKTCTQESSHTFTRWFSCQDTWSCQARCIRKGRTFYWMGKLFHHSWKRCFHRQWKYSNSKSQIQEEVMNLSGSKTSQWSINMQALLFLICGWPHSKVPWMQGVLNHWYEERLLDGTTPPRFKTTYMYVNWYRKIPMDSTSNGYECHFPMYSRRS